MITPTPHDVVVRNAIKREDGASVVCMDVHTTYRVLMVDVVVVPPIIVPYNEPFNAEIPWLPFNEPFNAEIPWLPFKQVAVEKAIELMSKWN